MGLVPNSKGNCISSKVYSHLNCISNQGNSWSGWNILWLLNVTPQVKYFIWTMFHGKVRMYDYLPYIGLGPQNTCVFYGLDLETAKHLFNFCPKSKCVWSFICNDLGKNIPFNQGIF